MNENGQCHGDSFISLPFDRLLILVFMKSLYPFVENFSASLRHLSLKSAGRLRQRIVHWLYPLIFFICTLFFNSPLFILYPSDAFSSLTKRDYIVSSVKNDLLITLLLKGRGINGRAVFKLNYNEPDIRGFSGKCNAESSNGIVYLTVIFILFCTI